jgi:hypothetical protein
MAHINQTVTAPETTGIAGAYGKEYIDTYSLGASTAVPMFTQEVWPEIFKNYGDGFLFLDFLRAASREFEVPSRRLTAFQKTFDERPVTISNVISATGAGLPIYFQLDDTDYDAAGGTYLRVGNVVEIPPEFFTISGTQPSLPVQYKVTAAATTGGVIGDSLTAGTGHETVYTAYPLDILAVIPTHIHSGTKFAVGGTAYAPGTAGISGIIDHELQYNFKTIIQKEGCAIEGGASVFKPIVAGVQRLWDRSLVDVERRLDRQMDYTITNGQLNTNTALVQTSLITGASQAVLSTEGIMQKVANFGMDLPVANGSTFEFDDFDAIRELLQSKGITNGNLTFAAATDLYSQVASCPFHWIEGGYSPGTSLMNMTSFGVNFNAFKKDSYNVQLCEISSFTRPTGFGVIDAMKMQGLILSDNKSAVSVESGYGNRQKLVFPNFGIGYLPGRKRIMKPRGGVDELPYANTSGIDGSNMDLLTEYMVFMMDFDKMIHVYESSQTS